MGGRNHGVFLLSWKLYCFTYKYIALAWTKSPFGPHDGHDVTLQIRYLWAMPDCRGIILTPPISLFRGYTPRG